MSISVLRRPFLTCILPRYLVSTFKLDTVNFLHKPLDLQNSELPALSRTLSWLDEAYNPALRTLPTRTLAQFRVPRPNFLSSFATHPRYLETRKSFRSRGGDGAYDIDLREDDAPRLVILILETQLPPTTLPATIWFRSLELIQ